MEERQVWTRDLSQVVGNPGRDMAWHFKLLQEGSGDWALYLCVTFCRDNLYIILQN